MRPIDADALLEKDEWLTWDGDSYNVIHVIDVFCAPTLDVEPVRHGRWIISSDGYYPYCSECKERPKSGDMTKHCPNCGAKMDF